nr:hypothetical protein [Lacticaseibacillus pantheris]
MPLSDAVGVLPGVGPKRVEALADLGIVTVNDLLFFIFRFGTTICRSGIWQRPLMVKS